VRAVDDLKAHYPLPLLLQLADLPRSTFYDHRRRLSGSDTRAGIKKAIRNAFSAANSAYGHRRILAVLLRQGWQVSKKTVLKLMRELGLQCPVRRRKRYNSFRGDVGEAADNVLNRQFATESRHTKWVTDVTEFNVGTTKVYLSPVLDLHDNRVISATAGPSPSVKMVTDGLRLAIDTLNPGEKPLIHSDQGFQGGFNWSSQHLVIAEVFDGSSAAGSGSGDPSEVALAWSSEVSTAGRGRVLGADRDGVAA
jgi:putative transposase